MSEMLGGRFQRHGVEYLDAWFVYAALADTGRPVFLVKVGVSCLPLKRIAQVHMSSPHPITAAMWAMVGGKSEAMRAEARIKKAFSDRRTRGEWFEFDKTSQADKDRFNFTVRSMCASVAAFKPSWHRVEKKDLDTYIASCIKDRLEIARKRG